MLPVIYAARVVLSPLITVITQLFAPLAIIVGFSILLELAGVPVITGTYEFLMQALQDMVRQMVTDMIPGVSG
ncbi:hypothetical protein [Halorubrum sp. GN11GM_10-3_MGM]|uniref:hypothetical protein n=1 Tax=Halorubrum sp. GN11GM_10-3_MGM TaxID=2518111 RepID=UPI00113D2A6E|nr:hypothetical protein [Halorubrum sp. GN11GM_10-3_MGM]TKX72184.1 hypothetical protein EXE40_04900 [Halorubrum sp. GN11GM_10-3_MGM]